MDGLTKAILITFAIFWGEELVQWLRHKSTLSDLIGKWEHGHFVRHVIVGALVLLLGLHLEFFP
jgi:hypothetical protein